jgi:hypothetical protein
MILKLFGETLREMSLPIYRRLVNNDAPFFFVPGNFQVEDSPASHRTMANAGKGFSLEQASTYESEVAVWKPKVLFIIVELYRIPFYKVKIKRKQS